MKCFLSYYSQKWSRNCVVIGEALQFDEVLYLSFLKISQVVFQQNFRQGLDVKIIIDKIQGRSATTKE